jgi:ubiquinone/menaquinone biosynthesis C-methylase UbiE
MKNLRLVMMLSGMGLAIGLTQVVVWAAAPEMDAARTAREAKRAEQWKVPEILRALGIQHGSRVADIGCGDGFLTFRLASAVGAEGRVSAVDIDDRALRSLRERVEDSGARNVEVIKGEEADPRLAPLSLDAAVILRAYHEFGSYREVLAAVRAALRPGGRLVIADLAPADAGLEGNRERQVSRHVLAPDIVEGDLVEAGFRIVLRVPKFAQVDGHEIVWLIAAEGQGTAAAVP